MIATDTRSVTLNYDLGPFEPSTIDPTYSFEPDFVTEVRRDPATQRLTFVYRFDDPPGTPRPRGRGWPLRRPVLRRIRDRREHGRRVDRHRLDRRRDLDTDSFGHGIGAIPLPAGVWLGLIALAGESGVIRLRRRIGLL